MRRSTGSVKDSSGKSRVGKFVEDVHMNRYSPRCLEFLEDRNLLSTLAGVHLPTAEVQYTRHYVPMKGTVVGIATVGEHSYDASGNVIVPVTSTGTGKVSHLGKVKVTE